MTTIEIDGNSFQDINGFYDEIHKKLCPDLEGFGRNLDALNDVLRGGFGVHEYGKPLELIWKNSQKSKTELGDTYSVIMDIIRSHDHISLSLE
ncbi:MAG TPA: barstar family protein [Candidatus Saccharimonadales bacterium]|nr:barstar family protein [Candidatus Saccharimonadales bacterium]